MLICAVFSACSKSSGPGNPPPPGPPNNSTGADVYVAGYEVSNTSNNTQRQVAKVWKNGAGTSLTDDNGYANAFGIAVKGSDVYVAGFQAAINNGTLANYTATIWKNGVATSLTDGKLLAEAHAVAVQGNDVYVAGYEVVQYDVLEFNGTSYVTVKRSNRVARLWKNGAVMPLELADPQKTESVANGIAVQGNDVYVVGYIKGLYSNVGYYGAVAQVWKNGSAMQSLSDKKKNDNANAIAFNNGDMYVAGTENVQEGNPSGTRQARLWKNGTGIPLDGASDIIRSSEAFGVTTYNNDVYTAGMSGTSTMVNAWKNGSALTLTTDPQSTQARTAYGVAVQNGDVYVAGFESNVQGKYVAKIWKNGASTSLTDGTKLAEAHAIAVVGK